MEYINIKLETVGDIRFVGARPVMRATWLSLLVYCAKQENSGRIANCRSWGNDTWAQIAGLRKSEVHAPCGLWSWEGDDLVVWGYPLHNEQVCRLRRDTGRLGGIASGSSRRSTKREANGSPFASPNGEATLEQKGKEKEREENEERENMRESSVRLAQVESIATAYCRQDAPIEVRQCIADDLTAGTSYEDFRRAVNECMTHIRKAPGGASNQYVPKALTFFQQRQWRSPEAFAERWKPRANGAPLPTRREAELPTTSTASRLTRL